MFVKLNRFSEDTELRIKHNYDEQTQKPVSTNISLILQDNVGGEIYTGHSQPKHGDQFTFADGRKYALLSLFRQLESAGYDLGKDDKRSLWKLACPQYYKSATRHSRKHRRRVLVNAMKRDLEKADEIIFGPAETEPRKPSIDWPFVIAFTVLLLLIALASYVQP